MQENPTSPDPAEAKKTVEVTETKPEPTSTTETVTESTTVEKTSE